MKDAYEKIYGKKMVLGVVDGEGEVPPAGNTFIG